MSRASGEKARANIQKRNRTAQRAKDRDRLAEIKRGGAGKETPVKTPKSGSPRTSK